MGLALQGAAWVLPSAPQEVRVSLSVLSILLVIFSQGSRYEGLRAWLVSFTTLLTANYPLVIAAILSGAVIVGLSSTGETDLIVATRFVMTGLLAASLSALIMSQSRQPSVKVVKGSSDRAYLVEDRIKRCIPDPLTLVFILLDTYCEVERISDLELKLYREGKSLPRISACDLVKGSGPAVYVIWEGHRKHIPDPPTFQYFFANQNVRELSDADLEDIPRTGTLRSILSIQPTVTVHGNVENITIGR